MKTTRKLALRREVLSSLVDADLGVVAAGQPETLAPRCDPSLNTCFSCLTYISCNPVACTFTLHPRYC